MPELVAVWNATYGDGGIDAHIHDDIVRILMLTLQRRNVEAGIEVWRAAEALDERDRAHLGRTSWG